MRPVARRRGSTSPPPSQMWSPGIPEEPPLGHAVDQREVSASGCREGMGGFKGSPTPNALWASARLPHQIKMTHSPQERG